MTFRKIFSVGRRGANPDKKSFFRRNEGSLIVEFAILGPVFILILVGVFQVVILMMIQNALDEAVRDAGRFGITGYTGTSGNRAGQINAVLVDKIKAYSLGLANTNKLNVTVSAFSTLAQVPSSLSGGVDYGSTGQVVVYEITCPWSSLIAGFSSSSTLSVKARTVVINEPWEE